MEAVGAWRAYHRFHEQCEHKKNISECPSSPLHYEAQNSLILPYTAHVSEMVTRAEPGSDQYGMHAMPA